MCLFKPIRLILLPISIKNFIFYCLNNSLWDDLSFSVWEAKTAIRSEIASAPPSQTGESGGYTDVSQTANQGGDS